MEFGLLNPKGLTTHGWSGVLYIHNSLPADAIIWVEIVIIAKNENVLQDMLAGCDYFLFSCKILREIQHQL